MIDSREKLKARLMSRPIEHAQVIAARAALRVLPYAFGEREPDNRIIIDALRVFRVTSISWTARNFPANDIRNTAADKSIGTSYIYVAAAYAVQTAVKAYAAALAVNATNTAALAVNATNTAALAVNTTDISSDSADLPKYGDAYPDHGDAYAIWENTLADCDWLAESHNHADYSANTARLLTREPLWLRTSAINWPNYKDDAVNRLLTLDPTYQVWIDWYNRRIEGHDAAFEIPGDTDRIEDKKILIRLADATNVDFWDKGATYVNTTLQRWIDEARARVAPPPPPQSTKPLILNDLLSDPQDSRSPVFGNDPNGKIAINRHAGVEQMHTDAQAQTRHGLARRMAKALHDGLFGHNGVENITDLAKDYLAGFGEQAEQSNPAILILFGDLIRSEIAKHRAAGPDDVLQPLPTGADSDASAFLSAHNMFVGSDAYLDALDRTLRGPDVRLPVVSSTEIKAIADEIYADGILAEPTHDYMVKAAGAAPADFNPDNRHSRFVAGLAQNFARYAVEIIATHPKELAGIAAATGIGAVATFGVITTITVGAAVAGGVTAIVTVAYHIARNIIANEDKYRRWLGTSPAGKHNIERIIAFVKSLPFKSLKDD
jgi:hypothetical protein